MLVTVCVTAGLDITGGLGSQLIGYALFKGDASNATHLEVDIIANNSVWPGERAQEKL